MKIERIELHTVSIPLLRPFTTSFGTIKKSVHIIVKMYSEGLTGFGEAALIGGPSYSYETLETARHIQKDYLIPALLGKNIPDIESFENHIDCVRGNNFAKYGLEGAFWHLLSIRHEKPLYKLLGGSRTTIPAGVGIGIEKSPEELLNQIEIFLNDGYKRIKLKIKPGWDVDIVKTVRKRFGDIPLMVDANAAYTLDDIDILRELDKYELLMIEQPFHHEDLTEHAELQSAIKTPVCLDESIDNIAAAKTAIALQSCKIINIKPGRVGGLNRAKLIHDLCEEENISVWCGGMLEFGIGRAMNVALCSLPNFTFPGDVSSGSRYFSQDIVSPPIEFINGVLELPDTAGLGFEPDDELIKNFTTSSYAVSS